MTKMKYIAVKQDDGSIKLFPSGDVQMIDLPDAEAKPPEEQSGGLIFVIAIIAAIGFICYGWKLF